MGGAQCETYTVNPQQMRVDPPTNVNDCDINSTGKYGKPFEVPTDMTYSLFRIRASTVWRKLVDAAWESGFDLDELPYHIVLDYDKKFRDMMTEFEKVFCNTTSPLSAISRQTDPRSDGQNSPTLSRQRHLGQFALHCRFCRLHRPYLVRGSQAPLYAYSRMVCLKSARKVIEFGKLMGEMDPQLAPSKFW